MSGAPEAVIRCWEPRPSQDSTMGHLLQAHSPGWWQPQAFADYWPETSVLCRVDLSTGPHTTGPLASPHGGGEGGGWGERETD